jgi:hypothetical protein
LLLPLGCYLLGAGARFDGDHGSLWDVSGFEPVAAQSWGGIVSTLLMSAGAVCFLFVAPVLLAMLFFRGFPKQRSTAHVWSIAVNCAALVLGCLLLRHTTDMERLSFCILWFTWTVCLAVAAHRWGEPRAELAGLWRRYRQGLLVGLATVAVGISLFAPQQFLQCFNGDGTEAFELARSLRENFLPTWQIEAFHQPDALPQSGAVIVFPMFINSYWTFGLQLLLGEGELATRLSFWVYLLGIMLACYRIQRQSGQESIWATLCLAMSALITAVWFTFYTGYDPYLADLAHLGVPDVLFTLLLCLSFDCLRQKDGSGWVLCMVLGTLVLYAGPVVFVLTSAAAWVWKPWKRRDVVKTAFAGSLCLAAVLGFYLAWGWQHDLLEAWWATLQEEYVHDYVSPQHRFHSGLLYLGLFVVGVGGIPVIGLLRAFRRSAWERTTATVILAYLLIVLRSATKNLHYLGPLLTIGVLLWTMKRPGDEAKPQGKALLITLLSMGVSLFLCWPNSRPIFTLTRELGERTTFQTDSYHRATRWAGVSQGLYNSGFLSWDMSPQTWVHYSQLDDYLVSPRALVISKAHPPPGYELLAEAPLAKIYVRTADRTELFRFMQDRQVEKMQERFPRILQNIAIPPRPPQP